MFKVQEGYFIARAGTHMLWRLSPQTDGPVYFETSDETDEVVRWYVEPNSAFSWLVREAGLAREEARQRMREADLWYNSMTEQKSASPPAAKRSSKEKGAVGQ